MKLGDQIRLGEGERKTGGWRRDSILSNTLEAIIGAVYLDSNFSRSKTFICELFRERLEQVSVESIAKDPKTTLQEILQARKLSLPEYSVIAEEGQAHNRKFTVECVTEVLDVPVTASGKSKRNAEQAAASKVLKSIKSDVNKL